MSTGVTSGSVDQILAQNRNQRRYHSKRRGPFENVVGTIDVGLVNRLANSVGDPDKWQISARETNKKLQEGRSLILREVNHRDTPLRRAFAEIEPILDVVKKVGCGSEPGRIVVAYLPPGARILPHRDSGEYYKFHNRIHVPLATNPGAIMINEGFKYRMTVGNIYLFQNLVEHAAMNATTGGRMHLIIDMLDDRYNAFIYKLLFYPLMIRVLGIGSAYRGIAYLRASFT